MDIKYKNDLKSDLLLLKSFGFNYIKNIRTIKNTQKSLLPDNLEKLNEIIKNCHLCKLSLVSKNKILLENKNYDLVFISLNTLDINNYLYFYNSIKKILNINDINILNMLKCNINFKSNNLNNEINVCSSYIKKELDIIQPKLIVFLGDIYNHIFDIKDKVGYGNIININNTNFMCLHDAHFITQNPSLRSDFENYLNKIKIFMEKN